MVLYLIPSNQSSGVHKINVSPAMNLPPPSLPPSFPPSILPSSLPSFPPLHPSLLPFSLPPYLTPSLPSSHPLYTVQDSNRNLCNNHRTVGGVRVWVGRECIGNLWFPGHMMAILNIPQCWKDFNLSHYYNHVAMNLYCQWRVFNIFFSVILQTRQVPWLSTFPCCHISPGITYHCSRSGWWSKLPRRQ